MSSFSWDDFLALAEKLAIEARQERNEGKRRTAIGRAYYAAFNQARTYAISQRIVSSADEGSVHATLSRRLSEQSNREVANVGNILRTLFKARKHADYDLAPPCTDLHLDPALRQARDILGRLTKLAAS